MIPLSCVQAEHLDCLKAGAVDGMMYEPLTAHVCACMLMGLHVHVHAHGLSVEMCALEVALGSVSCSELLLTWRCAQVRNIVDASAIRDIQDSSAYAGSDHTHLGTQTA